MELYQIKQFIAVAETGSMGKAAERLYLSRAAISQNIKRLEQELGCNLFDREHNRLAITPYGELVLKRARNVLDELATLHDEIATEKRSRETLVRIGHFSIPLSYFELPGLARSLPSCSFHAQICSEKAACEGLAQGEFDIAIVSSQTTLPRGMVETVIGIEQALLSVPPSSPLYSKDSLALSDLKDTTLLVPDNYPGCSEWYRNLLAAAQVDTDRVAIIAADKYIATMSASDHCHFSTTLMAGMFGLGNGRKPIPIEEPLAKRKIVALSRNDGNPVVESAVKRLRSGKQGPFDTYDIFPYLMFPNEVANLQIDLQI